VSAIEGLIELNPIDVFREPVIREVLEELSRKIGDLSDDIQSDEKRKNVHESVQNLFQVFTSKDDIRENVAKFSKPLLEKMEILTQKPLFKSLLQQIDLTDLSISLTSIKESPLAFMDNLAYTVLNPTFHSVLRHFELEPVDIQLADNALSKTNLKLSSININIPNPPDTFRIRTTSDMEFNNNQRFFSKAKVLVVSSISIRDLVLNIQSNFEYLENSLFISLHRKGSFQAKVKQLNLVISLLLEKSNEKIIFSGPNEQKCQASGFFIEFSPQMNEAEILNKLTSSFNGQINAALNRALEKQLVRVMKDVALDLNDFLAIYYKNREK